MWSTRRAGFGGHLAGQKQGHPPVASYHTHLPKYLEHYGLGMLEPLLWELLKAAHNQALLNLCTSTAMVQELSDKGSSTPISGSAASTPICSVPNCATTPCGSASWSTRRPWCPAAVRGRLSAEKQIERIKPVLEALPDARLALVGDGPPSPAAGKHFEGTATTFVGYLAGEELASAYASGDAFLFPSSTETLGLVLLEAMAAGCPVVGRQPRRHSGHHHGRGQRLPL